MSSRGLSWCRAGALAHGEGKPGWFRDVSVGALPSNSVRKMGRGDSGPVTFPISVWIRWLGREAGWRGRDVVLVSGDGLP